MAASDDAPPRWPARQPRVLAGFEGVAKTVSAYRQRALAAFAIAICASGEACNLQPPSAS
jgi:hypothetical protein